MPETIKWAQATTLGLIAAVLGVASIVLAMRSGLVSRSSEMVLAVLGGSFAAMIWSSAQWFVLRRSVRRAGWWIPANGVAAAVAAAIASLVLLTPPPGTYGPGVVVVVALVALPALAAAAIIWGVVTGAVLTWLLDKP